MHLLGFAAWFIMAASVICAIGLFVSTIVKL
jgi:hypothetical protein